MDFLKKNQPAVGPAIADIYMNQKVYYIDGARLEI